MSSFWKQKLDTINEVTDEPHSRGTTQVDDKNLILWWTEKQTDEGEVDQDEDERKFVLPHHLDRVIYQIKGWDKPL